MVDMAKFVSSVPKYDKKFFLVWNLWVTIWCSVYGISFGLTRERSTRMLGCDEFISISLMSFPGSARCLLFIP